MSAWSHDAQVHGAQGTAAVRGRAGYAGPSTDEECMAQSTAGSTTTGGLAAGIRWDLSHLYAGPDDPQIEKDLSGALAAATAFAERYRGRVASLAAPELARALDELEALQEPAARAGSYAGLLFAADTQTPRHG